MPLTPTDVANKQFRIAFRGYSLDEVDAFLDEVETELSRLLQANAQLSQGGAPVAPVPAAPEQAEGQQGPAAAAAPAEQPALSVASGHGGQEAALRTLLLAQRTADEAIAEARAEAEQILSAARAEAESSVTGARTEADELRSSARAQADELLGSARQRAASVDADVAAKVQAATGGLEQQRQALEARIEQLRAFEREYRTRLRAYLETQLRELGDGGAPDDAGQGVPPAARTAAVTGASRAGGAPGSRTGRGDVPAVPAPEPVRGLRPVEEDAAPSGDAGRKGAGDDAPAVPSLAPAPSGPPAAREAGLRAVPPLRQGGPAVGPFTVVPAAAGGTDGTEDDGPGDGPDADRAPEADAPEDRTDR